MDDGLAPPQPATTRTATRTAAASANDSIYAAVLRLKRAAAEAEEVVHGWTVSVKPREGTTQTDIKLVSPDGGKFFSLVSIRKELGIADARAEELHREAGDDARIVRAPADAEAPPPKRAKTSSEPAAPNSRLFQRTSGAR